MADVSDPLIADIYYLKPDPLYDTEKPYEIASAPPPGIKKTNIMNTPFKTPIMNARGKEEQFKLYTSGFEWARQTVCLDVSNEEGLDRYLADMEAFIGQHLNASKVIAYDYVVRQQREKNEPRPPGVPRKVKKQILGAHLDISGDSAVTRVKLKCGDTEAAKLLQRRWHIVNAWRPLKPVKSMPLALCDSRTLAEDDTVASDIVLPHLQIEAFEVWYNPKQRWHYLKDQQPEEVLLMMNYDSQSSTRCAHTAFEDPTSSIDDPKRHSIELRCMVFF